MLKKYIFFALKKHASKNLVLGIDLFLVNISFVISYLVRFELNFSFDAVAMLYQCVIISIVSLFSFIIVGSYKGVIRHTDIRDAFNIVYATFLMVMAIFLITLSFRLIGVYKDLIIPYSVIAIHYLVATFLLIISRFLFKIFYDKISNDLPERVPVLIYGAGDSGIITYQALKKDTSTNYDVIGFIDDEPQKKGKKINQTPIYSLLDVKKEFLSRNSIEEIIISIQNLSSFKMLEITDYFMESDVNLKIVPPLVKWIDGDLSVKQIEKIKIEDLLDREPIDIKNPIVERDIHGKVILITGAAGSIGSEITKQLSNYKYKKLILIDQAESPLYELQQELSHEGKNDIISIVAGIHDKNRMINVFERYRPNKVFHAAAYKHVPLMEESPYEAIKVNVIGTKTIVDLAEEYGVNDFIMISTDKAVNPTNIMGATKRIAELYISCKSKRSSTIKYTTTRFGNVLGSNGSVIPLFKNQIARGLPLTVTHKEITRYFMTIPEACGLVLEAGTMGKGGEIFVFDMGKPIKIFNLAKKMIKLSGLRYPEDISIKITGLRPGEKLYEELLADGELTKPTHHDKIMIANSKDIECDYVLEKINKLCEDNCINRLSANVSLMKIIVPEFVSKNSIYEELD